MTTEQLSESSANLLRSSTTGSLGSSQKQNLQITPTELTFNVNPKKQTVVILKLTNTYDIQIGFKIKTTTPKYYTVKPNIGVIKPNETREVNVTLSILGSDIDITKIKDRFQILSALASTSTDDNVQDIFTQANEKDMQFQKIKCHFTSGGLSSSKLLARSVSQDTVQLNEQNISGDKLKTEEKKSGEDSARQQDTSFTTPRSDDISEHSPALYSKKEENLITESQLTKVTQKKNTDYEELQLYIKLYNEAITEKQKLENQLSELRKDILPEPHNDGLRKRNVSNPMPLNLARHTSNPPDNAAGLYFWIALAAILICSILSFFAGKLSTK